MNPPKPLAFRQNSAYCAGGRYGAVARGAGMGEPVSSATDPAGAAVHHFYPSLPLWPVRSADGSFFSGMVLSGSRSAAFRQRRNFRCRRTGNAVSLGSGISPNRGRNRCSRPSSLWPFLPQPLPLAGPMTPNAPLSGQALALRLLTPRAMTCFWGLHLGPVWGWLSSKAVLTSEAVGQAWNLCLTQATILNRGSKTCSNPSRHSPCLSSLQDAMARSIPTAPVWARLVADFLVQSQMTIWQKAPSQAAFWVQWPQIRGFAAKFINRPCRFDAVNRAIRGIPRVAFVIASPVRGRTENLWGDQCSRRS